MVKGNVTNAFQENPVNRLQFIHSTNEIFLIVPESIDDMVSIGALCSKYSRSSKPLKQVYREEFLNNPNRGVEFYERVLNGYGDDSVADMVGGGLTFCFENIPILWSTQMLGHRLLGAIEKSTRYVPLDENSYYKINPQIDHWSANAMKTFVKAFDKKNKELTKIYGDPPDIPVKNAIRSEALDLTRRLLPMTATTSLAITANIRQWVYMINQRAHNIPAMYNIKDILEEHFPVFAKRINIRDTSHQDIKYYPYSTTITKAKNEVTFLKYNPGYSPTKKITETGRTRLGRRDKIPRDFESYTFLFGIMTNVGIFREFHRHRFCSIYDVRIYTKGPHALLGDPVMFVCHVNIRELVHLIELRSGDQTHKDFRQLVDQMLAIIRDKLHLSDDRILFKFLNMDKSELGRLASEKKIYEKGVNSNGL